MNDHMLARCFVGACPSRPTCSAGEPILKMYWSEVPESSLPWRLAEVTEEGDPHGRGQSIGPLHVLMAW